MKKIGAYILQGGLLFSLCTMGKSYVEFIGILPTPSKVAVKGNPIIRDIKLDLKYLGAGSMVENLTKAVYAAYLTTNINPKILVSLMYTESRFDHKAIGPKNRTNIRYKGIMQTPTATHFADVDVMHGAKILQEKLKRSKGDVQLALAYYKGGNNPVAHKQAKQVMSIFYKLQRRSELVKSQKKEVFAKNE